jgi:hypothetical protein
MQLVVSLTESEPVAQGRTWSEAEYARRDAVLTQLGLSRLVGRSLRRRAGSVPRSRLNAVAESGSKPEFESQPSPPRSPEPEP